MNGESNSSNSVSNSPEIVKQKVNLRKVRGSLVNGSVQLNKPQVFKPIQVIRSPHVAQSIHFNDFTKIVSTDSDEGFKTMPV